ncbi:hydroxyacid dehydrogenase [Allorhizocola rhizosphaerae]|uniref:hydroxyacid dehydrogenase n=1 Tax=Allorhizocola rhizosphaerae TaxID=1872709 RepID=UPI001B8C6066|nr:hydroxyacid dehydrogenase [Allorhizocola rhizosphaerae]
MTINGVALMTEKLYHEMFDAGLRARLGRTVRLGVPLGEAEALITGWGSPRLDAELLDRAPRLRVVAHTGGSVKALVTPACWERALLVTSAAAANAVPVADYTIGAILLAAKRVPAYAALYRANAGQWEWRSHVPDPVSPRRTAGVIGFSRIGRRVVELLRHFDFDVLVTDPYAEARDVPAELTTLDDLLAQCDIVTLHAPATQETQHLLDARRLAMLRDGATVINTARGSLIDTDALTAECVKGRLSAVLDVTDPEPLPPDSPLYHLPHVMLTPHVAGAMGGEMRRLAELAVDELERYARGEPLLHRVHPEHLDRLA